MSRKHTFAGLALAAMMAIGVASTALADENDRESNATLQAGPGNNICALTVNGNSAISFGIYTYTVTGEYLQSGVRSSAVDFTVVLVTDDHPTNCAVSVLGEDLVFGTYTIPVGRISLAQDGGTVTVNTVAAVPASPALPQTLISAVGGDPLGNGTANVTATLTLTSADDNNAPGTYVGSITFTSTPAVP